MQFFMALLNEKEDQVHEQKLKLHKIQKEVKLAKHKYEKTRLRLRDVKNDNMDLITVQNMLLSSKLLQGL